MGGESSQKTTQNSTTQPWQPAQGLLTGILGQANGYLGQTGINPTQTNALNTIEQNAGATSSYAPQIQGLTSNLLNGGGATNEVGRINQNYQNYYNQTNPLASNTNYDPMQTPGIGDQLQSLKDSITQDVNGSFAASGRDGSGYNQKALGQGLTAGLAPILTAQYNQNVQNQQGAANNLYGAGNTTSGAVSALNQQGLGNQAAGVGMIGQGLDASNAGANATLQAEAQRLGIPLQNLGLLSSLGIPIAGLGSQSSGTSNTTNQMSGVQQFLGITQGLGNLFGGGGGGGGGGAGSVAGIAKFLSDRRLKRDIERVGELPNGLNVYTFRYLWDDQPFIGLMADEVQKVIPDAVSMVGDYLAVDYGMVMEAA
jgi:hypothetical protein